MRGSINKFRVNTWRYARQLRDLWSSKGFTAVVNRIRSKLAAAIDPKDTPMEVLQSDVLAADPSRAELYKDYGHSAVNIPEINWIVVPHAPGSGGGTTIFRIINYLQSHGYRNTIYFYDVYGGDHRYYADVARSYYQFDGPIAKVDDGMRDAHAVVATAWSTAYPAFNAKCRGRRFYFVQDFEPYFYPRGAMSVLAENTYRMNFYGITAGRWLTEKLRSNFDMESDFFDFGCDTTVYSRNPVAERNGVVFYARPGAARRAFELGLLAIQLFASRRPDIPIHFYGGNIRGLPFKVVNHGIVTPQELNAIYNQCYAGLSLSMTNVSLVPHEMLAAGCIPVVNDAEHNRLVLDNPYVKYTAPEPHALAAALESVITDETRSETSRRASESVRGASWDHAGAKVDVILRRVLSGG
jgi:glycosyltransferase involved in cell wall biosynthesis